MYSKKRITIDIEYATEYQEYMSDDMIKITPSQSTTIQTFEHQPRRIL